MKKNAFFTLLALALLVAPTTSWAIPWYSGMLGASLAHKHLSPLISSDKGGADLSWGGSQVDFPSAPAKYAPEGDAGFWIYAGGSEGSNQFFGPYGYGYKADASAEARPLFAGLDAYAKFAANLTLTLHAMGQYDSGVSSLESSEVKQTDGNRSFEGSAKLRYEAYEAMEFTGLLVPHIAFGASTNGYRIGETTWVSSMPFVEVGFILLNSDLDIDLSASYGQDAEHTILQPSLQIGSYGSGRFPVHCKFGFGVRASAVYVDSTLHHTDLSATFDAPFPILSELGMEVRLIGGVVTPGDQQLIQDLAMPGYPGVTDESIPYFRYMIGF